MELLRQIVRRLAKLLMILNGCEELSSAPSPRIDSAASSKQHSHRVDQLGLSTVRPGHVRETRKELGARFVLLGNVRQALTSIRVSAELLDAEAGSSARTE